MENWSEQHAEVGTQRSCPSEVTFRCHCAVLSAAVSSPPLEEIQCFLFFFKSTSQLEVLTEVSSLGFKNVFNTESLENI